MPEITPLAQKVMHNECLRLKYKANRARKLSDADILEIRASTLPVKEIAAKYGISLAYAYLVRAGVRRK